MSVMTPSLVMRFPSNMSGAPPVTSWPLALRSVIHAVHPAMAACFSSGDRVSHFGSPPRYKNMNSFIFAFLSRPLRAVRFHDDRGALGGTARTKFLQTDPRER